MGGSPLWRVNVGRGEEKATSAAQSPEVPPLLAKLGGREEGQSAYPLSDNPW